MFGNIIGIDGNNILIKINLDINTVHNLINNYVIMEDEDVKIVGEIDNIKDSILYVNLLGEIINNEFVYGISRKPAFKSSVKLVSKEKVPLILSSSNDEENKSLYIGKSAIYSDVGINIDLNKFFSNHFSIFGSTGSGKSCAIASIFQNLFKKSNYIPYRASLFIFDAYGEYHNAFSNLNEVNSNINYKVYTTDLRSGDEIIKIPLWLLTVDDFALLLGADKHCQLPIIEKMLYYVNIFAREEEKVIKHKNNVIAKALLDILSSGKSSSQIRDQVVSVLTHYNTRELNLETPIYQPGYTRPLRQCLLIDQTGKIREIELLTSFIEGFVDDSLKLSLPDGTFKYTLNDLLSAMDFALISEGILKSDKVFDDANILRVRLNELVNNDSRVYFEYDKYVTKNDYIKELLLTKDNKKAQIINFNINYIDDRLAKNITKIYSKLLFDYAKNLKTRGSLPINIILEEAHRYVQNDIDSSLIGYNIFERISKEGRKYGVMLGLVSQRPAEISETCLSQCSNFLIFKIFQPQDVNYISSIVPNITSDTVKKLSTLQPGMCIGFGIGFKVPAIIKMDLPSPLPNSSNCDISSTWFIEKK